MVAEMLGGTKVILHVPADEGECLHCAQGCAGDLNLHVLYCSYLWCDTLGYFEMGYVGVAG